MNEIVSINTDNYAVMAKAMGIAGANPTDPTGAGGGTIGTGQAPSPGEQGFTGNAQQQGTTPTTPQGIGQQPGGMGTIQ